MAEFAFTYIVYKVYYVNIYFFNNCIISTYVTGMDL